MPKRTVEYVFGVVGDQKAKINLILQAYHNKRTARPDEKAIPILARTIVRMKTEHARIPSNAENFTVPSKGVMQH